MNYADIKCPDIANGTGVRVSLFVSGCRHQCKNCFNKEAWNFNYGKEFLEEEKQRIISELEKPYITGLSLLRWRTNGICKSKRITSNGKGN